MYIEFVIIDNFLLTCLAGGAATRLCHNKINKWRIISAATVGTVTAVFYPFLRGGIVAELAVKLCLWAVLSVILFYKTPRAFVGGLMFLGCTFAIGGASYAVELCLFGNESVSKFTNKYPLFLVTGSGAAVYFAVRYCIRHTQTARVRAPYEYGTEVEVYGAKLKFSAFLDTGNCVFDIKSGLPVVITDIDRFTEKLDGGAAVRFARALPRLRKMTAATPAGTAEIYLVQPTDITVYSDRHGHKINAMVGLICGQGKRFSDSHELLLCPAAMTEGI